MADISASGLIEESYALERAGQIGAAMSKAEQAVAQARASGAFASLADALVCEAYLHFRLGHYEQSVALAREALGHAPDNSTTCVDAWMSLGLCAAEMEGPVAAEGFFHRAIDLSRQLGYQRVLRSALHNLSATVYFPRGQFDLSLAADEESFLLAIDLGAPEVAWFPLATMGWVHRITGQRARALELAEELHHFAPPGSLAEGFYYCLRADLAQDGEEPASALPLYTRARSIAEAVGDPGLNVLLRLGLSRYQRAAGNDSAARNWADDALTIAARVGYHHLQGMALIERGRAVWALDGPASAEADLRAAIAVLTPIQANFDLAQAYLLLAVLLHRRGHIQADANWIEAVSRIISGGYAFLVERERALVFPLLAAYLDSDDTKMAHISSRLLSQLLRAPPPPLRILTLGRFEVHQRGRVIPDHAWRPRRAGKLFRLLLLSHGRAITREQVIEALWPTKTRSSSRSLFHQATSALRRALEPDLPDRFPSRYLTVEGGQVILNLPDGSGVDFETFTEHVRRQEWEAALQLYRGELFPGDRYADWATANRERLKIHAIQAALGAAREALQAGRPDRARDACHRALALEPWQEEAVLLGMRACAALNDRAGALRLYRKLERTLREELSIAPQEEVQTFYQSLLRT